jgi:hypothetical protein
LAVGTVQGLPVATASRCSSHGCLFAMAQFYDALKQLSMRTLALGRPGVAGLTVAAA